LKLAALLPVRDASKMNQLPIELRIERALRLLRMIEQDRPLLETRVAPLSREHQESAKSHAVMLAELTKAEIQRLHQEKADAANLDS
jgi:hypothetical protein